jgi:shikimate dehydrogenase
MSKLLLGLVGAGIQRSLTPAMHEEEGRHHGLRIHDQLIDLDRAPPGDDPLPALMVALRTIGFGGFNVTYPCKQAVIAHLDGLSDEARAMGAVNTVVADGGRLVGHNTDGAGWADGLQRALPDADLGNVVLVGAGGAGSAIAHAVLRLGAGRLVVHDSDAARAEQLVHELGRLYGGARVQRCESLARALAGASGLVQATPMGMDKLPGMPVDPALLHAGLWVSEIIYFPLETALVKAARAAGCRVVDGGGMAVGQAVRAFRLFTGRDADAARMEAHFRRLLAERG